MTETLVYRAVDSDGTLLYVGMTYSIETRLRAHRRDAEWFARVARIEIERHPTRELAHAAERAAIATERPLFNAALKLSPPLPPIVERAARDAYPKPVDAAALTGGLSVGAAGPAPDRPPVAGTAEPTTAEPPLRPAHVDNRVALAGRGGSAVSTRKTGT